MAQPRQLARFSITEAEDGYRLQIEDDLGQTLELMADDEQLDLIIEALDDALGDEDYDEDGDQAA
jgi:hypothetical protein